MSRALVHPSQTQISDLPSMFAKGPVWREIPVSEHTLYILRVPVKEPFLRVSSAELPQGPTLRFQSFFFLSLSPGLLLILQSFPRGEKCSVSRCNGLFIPSYLS